ncbi:S8 family serine peptidase [Endozoicomonas atrinae]|uniref:S8 family serine peptidase n=1 Tax=Endozoicomonas atrinae TaxID=1333660 RepID=UPI003B001F9D
MTIHYPTLVLLTFLILGTLSSSASANNHPPEKQHGIILIEDHFTDHLGPFSPSHGQLMRDIIIGKYHKELGIKDKLNIRSWAFTMHLDVMKEDNHGLPPADHLKKQLPKSVKESFPSWLWSRVSSLPEVLANIFHGPLDRPPPLNLDTESHIIIVNQSYILSDYGMAKAILQEYIDRFPELPLFISAAGNDTNVCSEQAATINRHIGSTETPIRFYFFNEPQYVCAQFYNACNLHMLAAQDLGIEDFFINVIGDLGKDKPNKPAGVLKDRTVVAPYYTGTFNFYEGTSGATAYVTALAAMIHERAPELAPPDIASIIFLTADKKGGNMINETWGHGVVNPGAAMAHMDKLGYPRL